MGQGIFGNDGKRRPEQLDRIVVPLDGGVGGRQIVEIDGDLVPRRGLYAGRRARLGEQIACRLEPAGLPRLCRPRAKTADRGNRDWSDWFVVHRAHRGKE